MRSVGFTEQPCKDYNTNRTLVECIISHSLRISFSILLELSFKALPCGSLFHLNCFIFLLSVFFARSCHSIFLLAILRAVCYNALKAAPWQGKGGREMERNLFRIAVTLDGETFRRFAWFDTMVRRGGWRRPALFAAILGGCACVAFAYMAVDPQSALLGTILLLVGLGLPAVWLAMFARSVRRQARGMRLPRAVYNIDLTAAGVSCWHTAGGGTAETTPWADVFGAWRRPGVVYLYVQPGRAYLLPCTDDRQAKKIWAVLTAHLPAQRLHEKD